MLNQSRWNIVGSQAENTEREWDIADWGERERTELEREYGVGFKSGTVILVLPIVLNQHKVFLDITTGHINTEIFWDNVNSKINIRVIFRKSVYVQRFFWRYNFDSNNSEVFHIS
jgi:hypothetical protein